MWVDARSLKEFYKSPLGHEVQEILVKRLHEIWPNVNGQRILSIGYGMPLLKVFQGQTPYLFNAMPSFMGASVWPDKNHNRVALTESGELPFADKSIEKIIVMHHLEQLEDSKDFLREVWRVLVDGGAALIIVPNSLGLWSKMEKSPFYNGNAFSSVEIIHLLQESCFTTGAFQYALSFPPSDIDLFFKLSNFFSKVDHSWFKGCAGLLMVEGVKQVYASSGVLPFKWRARSLTPETSPYKRIIGSRRNEKSSSCQKH